MIQRSNRPFTPSGVRRSSFFPALVALACATWACGAPVEGEDEESGDTTVEELPIQNGSTNFDGLDWMRIRTARVTGPWACSGTVLDPRTVLTARHCVTTTGLVAGTIVSPASSVLVRVDGGTVRPVQQIAVMEPPGSEKHDVAILLLSAANALLDEDGDPIFTPMEPNPPANYLNATVRISGWGHLQDAIPTGAGVLRHGSMILDDDLVSPIPTGGRNGLTLRATSANQRGMTGDSGGPYWGDTRVEGTLPRGIIGVHSGDGPGGTEAGTRVHSIRSWARGVISNHHGLGAGEGLALPFSSSSELAGASRFSPDGNPASWTVTGGLLVQSGNVPHTTLVWEDHVVRDFDASVQIDSPDNDGAGIVFHFANPHYYYCEANDQSNVLRLRSRVNGTVTTLASATWNGTFAVRKTMKVTGRNLTYTCSFDGITISTVETRIPVGSVGLVQDNNAGVRFDNFKLVGG